jgi:hypothetical protein
MLTTNLEILDIYEIKQTFQSKETMLKKKIEQMKMFFDQIDVFF